MPVFTPHQDAALTAVAGWLKDKPGKRSTPQVFRLFGYAGTGKTTLAKHIAQGVDGEVLFAAFTGKAALVMRSKGCRDASTIHSLIYRIVESSEETPTFELWRDAPAAGAKLIIIDECSMVDAEMGKDLMSFGVPLLVLGDPAQLPPVQGGGFFTDCEPDAMLTEVHRQAQDDPIVRLSMDIRAGRRLVPGRTGLTEVVRRTDLDPQRVLEADQVLVGRNATRRAYNTRMRERRGFAEALPRQRRQARLPAQQPPQGTVQRRTVGREGAPHAQIRHADHAARAGRGHGRAQAVKVSVLPECFTGGIEAIDWQFRKRYDEFDYGYVLTVHKAQGSQWDDVVLFDESFAFPDSRERWLYTGVTRAAKRLTVVS